MSPTARLRAAITTWPRLREWLACALEALWLAPVLAFLGIAGGFVGIEQLPDPRAFVSLALVALIMPSLLEELFFRVLLVGPAASLARCAGGIALFVAWHPLQIFIFGEEWGRVVLNPLFLLAVAVLGVGLTRVYLKTRSVWPPVVLHWVTVLVWKLAGGPSPWG